MRAESRAPGAAPAPCLPMRPFSQAPDMSAQRVRGPSLAPNPFPGSGQVPFSPGPWSPHLSRGGRWIL